jgi:hypothetical protein
MFDSTFFPPQDKILNHLKNCLNLNCLNLNCLNLNCLNLEDLESLP